METTKRGAREDNLIGLVNLGLTIQDALALQAIARKLHHYDELACESELSNRQENKVTALEQVATLIAACYGMQANHQGDPRGWPITLSTSEAQEAQVCPH